MAFADGVGVCGGEAVCRGAAIAVEAHVGAAGLRGAELVVEADGVRVIVG